MNNVLLKADGLQYSYGQSGWALDGVGVELCAGSVLGIVGPNGSGKSTTVKILAGILEPASGVVELGGKDISKLTRRKIAEQLGYLPQLCSSVFNYRVEEVVSMGRFCHLKGMGFLDEGDKEQIEKAMVETETLEYRGRYLNQLSGGERQRVLLASVLCQEPKVLLLDEPTTGLDIHHQVSFFSLLKKLARDGMGVCVVTHDLNLAAMFCDKVMLVQNGSVVKTGDVSEVINEEALGGIYPDVFVGTHPTRKVPMVLPIDVKGDA